LAAAALLTLSMACSGNRGTIGALLGQQQDGRLFVREVPAGLAAARAGLQANDEILLIDGRDVRDLSHKQIHAHLSGDVGQPVKLTVLRGEDVLRVTLKRTPAPKSPRLSAK
jgi:C-terminal processing protease CtpA/Prc